MLRPFLVLGILSAATGACAEPRPVTGDGLKALSGALVELDTPLGTKLPIRFGSDGLVSAEAGELAPILGSAKDRGRWWVDGDKLCSKWFRWFDAEVRCITVAQEGTRLYWRKDNGETGTATLVEAPASNKPEPRVDVAIVDPKPATGDKPEFNPEPTSPSSQSDAAAAPASSSELEIASVEPTPAVDVAQRDTSAAKSAPDEGAMMRVGGNGLLEASSRVSAAVESGAEKSTVIAALSPSSVAPSSVPEQTASINDKLSPLRRESRPDKAQQPAAPSAQPDPSRSASSDTVASSKRAVVKSEPAKRKSVPPPPPSRTVALFRVYGVESFDVLNVRRGPAEDYDSIGAIPASGRRVEITGRCEDEWCPIRYGQVRGWVNSYYLVAEAPSGASSQSQVYLAKP